MHKRKNKHYAPTMETDVGHRQRIKDSCAKFCMFAAEHG